MTAGPRWTAAALLVLTGAAAEAQVRPFVFTVTTAPTQGSERWTVQYQAGYSERAAPAFANDGLEQRVGVQGDLGAGFTLLGSFGVASLDAQAATSTTQDAEVLKDLFGPERSFRVAAGAGLRREWEGTTTLLGRISLGRTFEASSLFANLRFERPFETGRDTLDLITTAGWLHHIGGGVHLGVEAIGEDLEGFWDAEEAEGGAKLMVGPSLHIAPVGRRFYASVCGGPILYATHSDRTSGAPRPLEASGNGYTVRVSVGYAF